MNNYVHIQEHNGFLVLSKVENPVLVTANHWLLGVPHMTQVTAKVLVGHAISQDWRNSSGKRKLHLVATLQRDAASTVYTIMEGPFTEVIPMSEVLLCGVWRQHYGQSATVEGIVSVDPPISAAALEIINGKAEVEAEVEEKVEEKVEEPAAEPKVKEKEKVDLEACVVFCKVNGHLCYYREGPGKPSVDHVFATGEALALMKTARRITDQIAVVGYRYEWMGDNYSASKYAGFVYSDIVTVSNELGGAPNLKLPPEDLLARATSAVAEKIEEARRRRQPETPLVYDADKDLWATSLTVHSIAGELFFKIRNSNPAVRFNVEDTDAIYKFRSEQILFSKEALVTLRELEPNRDMSGDGPLRPEAGIVVFRPGKMAGAFDVLAGHNLIHWSRIEVGPRALAELRSAVFSGAQTHIADMSGIEKVSLGGSVRMPTTMFPGDENMILPYRKGYVFIRGRNSGITDGHTNVVVYGDDLGEPMPTAHLLKKLVTAEPSGIYVPGNSRACRVKAPSIYANVVEMECAPVQLSALSPDVLRRLEAAYHSFDVEPGCAYVGSGAYDRMLLVSGAGRIDRWDHYAQQWLLARLRDGMEPMTYAEANKVVLEKGVAGIYIYADGSIEVIGSPEPDSEKTIAIASNAPIYRETSRALPAAMNTKAVVPLQQTPVLGFVALPQVGNKVLIRPSIPRVTHRTQYRHIGYLDHQIINEVEATFIDKSRAPDEVRAGEPFISIVGYASSGEVGAELVVPAGCYVGGWMAPLPVVAHMADGADLQPGTLHELRAPVGLKTILLAQEDNKVEEKKDEKKTMSDQGMELRFHFAKKEAVPSADSTKVVAFEQRARIFWDAVHAFFWVIWSSTVAKHDNNLYLVGELAPEVLEKIKGLPKLRSEEGDKAVFVLNGGRLWVRRRHDQGDYDVLVDPAVYLDTTTPYEMEHVLEVYEKHEQLKIELEALKSKMGARLGELKEEAEGMKEIKAVSNRGKSTRSALEEHSEESKKQLVDYFKDQRKMVEAAFNKGRSDGFEALTDAALVKDDAGAIGDLLKIMTPNDLIDLLTDWIELESGWKGFPAFALRHIATGEVTTFASTTFGDPDDNRTVSDILEDFNSDEEAELLYEFIEKMDLAEKLRQYLIARVETEQE